MDDMETLSVHGRAWVDGHPLPDEVTLESVADLHERSDALVWLDLLSPTRVELDRLAGLLHLDPHAVEDALAPLERPKAVRHADHLFFMTYATRLVDNADGGRLERSRVSGFVLPRLLVTVRLDDGIDMGEIVTRWEDEEDLLALGPGALVHGLLDVIVDGHFATIQQLDDAIEAMEDELFAENRTGAAFQRRIYGLRKDLVELRRIVLPMRELVNTVLRHRKDGHAELDSSYDDLYDHVMRAAEWTESLRDMVTTVFETNLSLQDARLNTIMKQLAAWAAIIAVPTAVTGWFGQNVPYPGFQRPLGLWFSVALIVGLSGVLYVIFRRRDWL